MSQFVNMIGDNLHERPGSDQIAQTGMPGAGKHIREKLRFRSQAQTDHSDLFSPELLDRPCQLGDSLLQAHWIVFVVAKPGSKDRPLENQAGVKTNDFGANPAAQADIFFPGRSAVSRQSGKHLEAEFKARFPNHTTCVKSGFGVVVSVGPVKNVPIKALDAQLDHVQPLV